MPLGQKDLDEIEKIVERTVQEKTKNLPTRDEFSSRMDEVMSELETIREEQALIGHQVSSHEDRLSTLEDFSPAGK